MNPAGERHTILAWLSFLALSVLSVGLICFVPGEAALAFVRYLGAPFLLLLVIAWVVYLLSLLRPKLKSLRGWKASRALPGMLCVLAGAWLLFAQADFGPKILMDEYSLASTARNIHERGEVCVTTRVVAVGENFRPSETSVDKRPWLYPLAVSLLHDIFGYSEANPYRLNAGLGLCLLGMAFWQARRFGGVPAGLMAVLMWASLPLLTQAASGGGMDLLNLCLIQFAILAGAAFLRNPTPHREGLFVLSGVLLAYARYESILFLAAVALLLAIGMYRRGNFRLSRVSILAPLLLTPLILHLKAQFGQTAHYEMATGVTVPFSLQHFNTHLPHALAFLFNTGHDLANSLWLSVIGSLALILLLVGLRRDWNKHWRQPENVALLVFILALAAHLVVLLSYHAGQFTDLFASRFALPFHLALLAAILLVLSRMGHWTKPLCKALSLLSLLFIISFTMPMNAKAIFSERSFVVREQAWLSKLREEILESDSLIIDRFTVAWSLRDWVALRPHHALLSHGLIHEGLRDGIYPEAYYIERVVYHQGRFQPVIEDLGQMHERFPGELIAERSFRPLTKTRVYRIHFSGESRSDSVSHPPVPATGR